MKRAFAIFFFLVVLTQGIAYSQNHPQHERLNQILNEYSIPGLSYSVFNGDSIVFSGGCGMADVESRKEVNEESLFRAGSITKMFVALSFLKLEQEGKVDLNATVRSIAPEIEIDNPWEDSHPVRIKHLLSHTAGLDDMHFNEFFIRDAESGPNPPLMEVLKKNPRSRKVRWKPGTCHAYSNPGYTLAAFILEKITRRNWDEYIREEIFRPLEMNHAQLRQSESLPSGLSTGYEGKDPQPGEFRPIWHWPSGSLICTARDLANAGNMMLANGNFKGNPFLKEEQIQKMEKSQSTLAAEAGLEYGYGFGNYSGYRFEHLHHGHNGGITGFYSVLRYYPQFHAGIVMLFNHGSPDDSAEYKIEKILLQDWLDSAEAENLCKGEAPGEFPESGWYRFASERNGILSILSDLFGDAHLSSKGDTLFISGFGKEAEMLLPCGNHTWRRVKSPGPDFVWGKQGDDSWIVLKTDYFEKEGNWVPAIKWSFFFSGLAILMLSLVILIISCLLRLFGRLKGKMGIRIWPALAFLSFIGMPICLGILPVQEFGAVNLTSIFVWILGIMFPVFSLAGGFSLFYSSSFRHNSLFIKVLISASVFFCLCGTMWTIYYGWAGLKLWDF